MITEYRINNYGQTFLKDKRKEMYKMIFLMPFLVILPGELFFYFKIEGRNAYILSSLSLFIPYFIGCVFIPIIVIKNINQIIHQIHLDKYSIKLYYSNKEIIFNINEVIISETKDKYLGFEALSTKIVTINNGLLIIPRFFNDYEEIIKMLKKE